MNYKKEFECCDPWFGFLKSGRKVVEGRINNKKYNNLKEGDLIKMTKESEYISLKVNNINKYGSFREMLENETLERVLPEVESIDDGVKIYREFYSEEVEKEKGVLAIDCVVIS